MYDNIITPANGPLYPPDKKAWESCQTYGGIDRRSPLGTFYCDLDCEHISIDDHLLLCQIGIDNGHPTINGLEIMREGRWLIFNTYIEAAGGYQDIVCRSASDKNIMISIKADANFRGKYDHIRFMIYDKDLQDEDEAMYVRAYSLSSPQHIDRVSMILKAYDDSRDDYRHSEIPVGVNNFRAYGIGNKREILKPNFAWFGAEFIHKNVRVVSRHYESYKPNGLASLKQWKEKA